MMLLLFPFLYVYCALYIEDWNWHLEVDHATLERVISWLALKNVRLYRVLPDGR